MGYSVMGYMCYTGADSVFLLRWGFGLTKVSHAKGYGGMLSQIYLF